MKTSSNRSKSGHHGTNGNGQQQHLRSSRRDGSANGNNGHKRPSLPLHQTQRPINFDSARTAWILSFLLILTLVVQFTLMAYHEQFLFRLNSLEGDPLEDVAAAESIASDAFNANAAHNFNDGFGDSGGGAAVLNGGSTSENGKNEHSSVIGNHSYTISMSSLEIAAKYANLSMEPIDILARAGVDHTAGVVLSKSVREARAALKQGQNKEDQMQEAELPSLEDIQAMYGKRSHIIGLERCKEYRDAVLPEHRIIGPAGIFNSATNLLKRLLSLNCSNKARMAKAKRAGYKMPSGMLVQAPWGKHNPVTWRLHHQAAVGGVGFNHAEFLPIVMIKDPITWMASMCRHSYEARWNHRNEHCPNLVPNKYDRGRQPGKGTMGVKVKFATQHIGDEPIPDKTNKTFVEYTSLVDLWNTWYSDWHGAQFPRLMVRFEDLMFHAEETVSQICDCGGGTMKPKFRYEEESAKGQGGPHAGSAGFLASLVTYGNRTLRMEGILTEENDAEYARQHLEKELMDMFGYAPI